MSSATYVASPLLAGFGVASIGLISTSPNSFRWPGATLILLTISTILLVASLQLGIISQKYFYSQADVESWWTEDELQSHLNELSNEQEHHFTKWRHSGWLALACYNAGIGALAAALATLLAPLPTDDCTLTGAKWAAVALMAVAAVLVLWFGIVTTSQIRGM